VYPKTNIALMAVVMALIIGGFLLYLRPLGLPSTTSSTVPFPSAIPSTTLIQFASVQNCTYTVTSNFRSDIYGGGQFYEEGTTTTTRSYVTTVGSGMTTGAIVTSTTSPTSVESIDNRNGVATVYVFTYLNEPYTVSCTYVK
jgi:hypothetical protein